jgi:nucleoside phosphorylase
VIPLAPVQSDEILERRLLAEADRRGEAVDAARHRVLQAGLDAEKERRERAEQAARLSVDVLLVTATMTEHRMLREVATSLRLPFERRAGRFCTYYHLGMIGTDRVASIQVEIGAFGAGGSASSCIQARAETRATALILIGTAFGIARSEQQVGDVLVSESVFLYDDRHAVDGPTPGRFETSLHAVGRAIDRTTAERWTVARKVRALSGPGYTVQYGPTSRRAASGAWVSRFRRLADEWRRTGETGRIIVGTLLSGGSRIESARFRDDLVAAIPKMDSPLIGGEMEAMGAISAANADEQDPGWIVVKGIADFADAQSRAKIDATRDLAARSSARAVLRALQTPASPV